MQKHLLKSYEIEVLNVMTNKGVLTEVWVDECALGPVVSSEWTGEYCQSDVKYKQADYSGLEIFVFLNYVYQFLFFTL